MGPLPFLDPPMLRELGLSYSRATAVSVDGFHARHFARLSDGALLAPGKMLHISDILSAFPTQLRAALLAVLPQVTGGFRLI